LDLGSPRATAVFSLKTGAEVEKNVAGVVNKKSGVSIMLVSFFGVSIMLVSFFTHSAPSTKSKIIGGGTTVFIHDFCCIYSISVLGAQNEP
jgi:hypothetical protein